MMLNFAGIIPARYASTRFPGKPLVMINGKTMIHRVFLQASKVLKYVCVATDDSRIEDEVLRFGGKVIMTSGEHKSGTDRCEEAVNSLQKLTGINFDVIINIQGDEPFIHPVQLEKIMKCFQNLDTQIATLVKPISDNEDIFNPNVVKAILDKSNRAVYFSRSPVPYFRGKDKNTWHLHHTYLKHLGIYAYRTEVLKEITGLSQTPLELAESLEQLRWLENGYRIVAEITDHESVAIDTPGDLDKLNNISFPD